MVFIRKCIDRMLICIDALINYITQKPYCGNKTVVILFQQIFGDSVIFQSSLKEYIKLFPKEEGFKIKLLIRPSVLKFMRTTMVLPEDIEYEEVDFKRFLEDYRYYKCVVKNYMNSVTTLIVPGTSLSAEIFSTANNASRKVAIVRCTDVIHPAVFALFYKIAYTEKIKPSKFDMMLQRHRLLLNYLGAKEYKAKLPNAIRHNKIINDDSYVVMCPGSSKLEKCWPIERFSEVADYIVDQYHINIHLCGGTDEVHFAKELINLVKNKDHIISHIGKTSFEEWSSIVEYADLVLGNDSATMHLAVAHRRKAICITGVYDKNMFFPYKVDELNEGDRLPVTVLKDMPCEYCRTIGYNAGYGNKECQKRIKANQCAICIEKITVAEIIEQVDKMLKEDRE